MLDESILPSIRSAVSAGEHITVMSFGAPGTGKTTTMSEATKGAVSGVFAALEGQQCSDRMVTVSALMSAITPPAQSHMTGRQVCHEVLLDALLPHGGDAAYRGGLHVREHPRTGFFVEGLTTVCVTSEAEALQYVRHAMDNFELEKQRCGKGGGAPLRVHSLVTLRALRRMADGSEVVSEVQLLDLAGWQRGGGGGSAANPKAATKNISDKAAKGKGGATAAAAAFEDIVIKAVMRVCDSLEQRMSHIPYRDAKLTRLLQNALGGRASCLCAVHVGLDNYEETEAMLQFAKRVSAIRNSVSPNSINYTAIQASHGERIRELCRLLGRSPEGLKTGGMAMSMASTDEEVELRDLVAECESLADLSKQWEATLRASERFKSGQDTGPRLDRKLPPSARVSEAPQISEVARPQPQTQRPEAEVRAGMDATNGGDSGVACAPIEIKDIGSKLQQLQLGRKGSRLRPMS
jgi:hypothetical protein